MARDPAFLFYDGDAARDVSHMNRLERGCYFDLIQAQRKFGRLSEEIVKKVLGKDFDTCWEACKICLSYDNHMYFIEWVENSTQKRQKYSEGRKQNRLSKKQHHMFNICDSYDKHMENENENENIDVSLNNPERIIKPGLHLFKNSPYYQLDAFCAAIPQWDLETCKYWHQAADEYSESKGARYKNWISAVKSWKRKQDEEREYKNISRPKTVSDESIRALLSMELS